MSAALRRDRPRAPLDLQFPRSERYAARMGVLYRQAQSPLGVRLACLEVLEAAGKYVAGSSRAAATEARSIPLTPTGCRLGRRAGFGNGELKYQGADSYSREYKAAAERARRARVKAAKNHSPGPADAPRRVILVPAFAARETMTPDEQTDLRATEAHLRWLVKTSNDAALRSAAQDGLKLLADARPANAIRRQQREAAARMRPSGRFLSLVEAGVVGAERGENTPCTPSGFIHMEKGVFEGIVEVEIVDAEPDRAQALAAELVGLLPVSPSSARVLTMRHAQLAELVAETGFSPSVFRAAARFAGQGAAGLDVVSWRWLLPALKRQARYDRAGRRLRRSSERWKRVDLWKARNAAAAAYAEVSREETWKAERGLATFTAHHQQTVQADQAAQWAEILEAGAKRRAALAQASVAVAASRLEPRRIPRPLVEVEDLAARMLAEARARLRVCAEWSS